MQPHRATATALLPVKDVLAALAPVTVAPAIPAPEIHYPLAATAEPSEPSERPTIYPEQLPKISGLLVLTQPQRLPMARHAVDNFLRQDWPHKQLVIANACERMVTNRPHPDINEYLCPRPATLGELRNYALDRADGEFVVFWNDDEWSSPGRLACQNRLFAVPTVRSVRLRQQLRAVVQLEREQLVAFRYDDPYGLAETVMFRRTINTHRCLADGSLALTAGGNLVLDHSSNLVVSFWHGLNRTPQAQFIPYGSTLTQMLAHHRPQPADLVLIQEAAKQYNLEARLQPLEGGATC